jgi:predicted nucleic acid-binding protein
MTGGIFVDTNVFVYARDTAQGEKHARAVEWLERIWRDQTGRTSMQVLSELYVTLTRKLRPGLTADAAWDDIEALLAWNPFPTDRDLITRARRVEARYRTNWWDGLVVAAAQLQDCDLLLSEDFQDGMQFGTVTVVSPFRLRAMEQQAAYAEESGIARRHRRPGRPARARGS